MIYVSQHLKFIKNIILSEYKKLHHIVIWFNGINELFTTIDILEIPIYPFFTKIYFNISW